jgi:hypothetical protein
MKENGIIEKLGDPVMPGKFKAYGYEFREKNNPDGLDDRYRTYLLNQIKGYMGFKSKNMQMIFQLSGSKVFFFFNLKENGISFNRGFLFF